MENTDNTLTEVFNQPYLRDLSDRTGVDVTNPSKVTLSGQEVVFNYTFTGRGAEIVFELAWSFTWRRFYFVKTTSSAFLFGAPDSILVTEDEFSREMKDLHASEDFVLVKQETPLSKDRLEDLIRRFHA